MRRIHQIIAFGFVLAPLLLVVAVVSRKAGLASVCNLIRNRHQNFPHDGPKGAWRYSLGSSFDEGFSLVFKSIFPIDLIIRYNTSDAVTHEIVARYASFSIVLTHELRGHFTTIPGTGCQKLSDDMAASYRNKVLIAQRGECSFVRKVENLFDSNLSPRAIIVANNIPKDELITMYHRTFNHNEEIETPILFISLEDYDDLKLIEPLDFELSISTVALDSIMGISLLMALSPPIIFLLIYSALRLLKFWRHRRMSIMNERYVAQLPVYMYKGNYLIPCSNFYEYLKATKQTENVPFTLSSSEVLVDEEIDVMLNHDSFVINGTDLYSLRILGLLFSNADFYPTLKCSICLGHLVPLQSRVLLLRCKHIYHEKCLSNWLIHFKKSCPLCNKMIRITDGPRSYGTFGRDLEAALDEEVGRGGSFEQTDDDIGPVVHDHESLPIPHINASNPHIGYSYASMPILPSHIQDLVSPSISASSGFSFVTTRSQSILPSGASVASEYLTPSASIASSGDDNRTDAAHSANSSFQLY